MIKGAIAGLGGVLAALAGAGWASADPAPPPGPALIAPAPEVGAPAPEPFVAASEATAPNQGRAFTDMVREGSGALITRQVGGFTDLLGGALSPDLINRGLGLTQPSTFDPVAASEMLDPRYYRMPTGEEASPYALQTNVPPGPFARVNTLKGMHAAVHGGLGRTPRDQLGQPFPGTAPAPGSNIPPGLEQFYVVPEPPVLPVPPVPPVG